VEIDNIRAAIDWALSPSGEWEVGAILTAAYAPVWYDLSMVVECRERAEHVLDALGPQSKLSLRLQMQLHLELGLALTQAFGPVKRP
jgi:predicted ATPase